MTTYDVRAGELLAWEVETGLSLPASVGEIIAIEDAGGLVDLETGQVWRNVTIEATPVLEALIVVVTAETAVQE